VLAASGKSTDPLAKVFFKKKTFFLTQRRRLRRLGVQVGLKIGRGSGGASKEVWS
jgi:hypothetical protein